MRRTSCNKSMQKCQHDPHRQKGMTHRSHKFNMHIEGFPLSFIAKKSPTSGIERTIIFKRVGGGTQKSFWQTLCRNHFANHQGRGKNRLPRPKNTHTEQQSSFSKRGSRNSDEGSRKTVTSWQDNEAENPLEKFHFLPPRPSTKIREDAFIICHTLKTNQ